MPWLNHNGWSCLNLNKSEIRSILLKKRAEVNVEYRKNVHSKAAYLLSKSEIFSRSQHCACYSANASEFNCLDIIELILAHHKNCYLPILTPEKKLVFGQYKKYDILQLNRYRILEPMVDKVISPEELDLVILPLVGFDLAGNRLGMGGGYYDRSFQFTKNQFLSVRKPFLLGVAYACQQIDLLVSDAWDVKLNGILTEKEIILF